MNEDKSLFIGKLQLIKQFRSIGFISEKLDVTVSIIREWFDGDIDNNILNMLDELIDKEFEEEIELSIDDDSLNRLKEKIRDDILLIESKLNTSETLRALGGLSLATFNRYKKGEIPLSNILYLRDNINSILNSLNNKDIDKNSGLIADEKLKQSIEFKKNKSSSLDTIKSDLNEQNEINEVKEIKKANIEPISKNKGDVNKVSKVSNNINITKYLFSGVEQELKDKFGEEVELKKIEFIEDKIIIEAGLKED